MKFAVLLFVFTITGCSKPAQNEISDSELPACENGVSASGSIVFIEVLESHGNYRVQGTNVEKEDLWSELKYTGKNAYYRFRIRASAKYSAAKFLTLATLIDQETKQNSTLFLQTRLLPKEPNKEPPILNDLIWPTTVTHFDEPNGVAIDPIVFEIAEHGQTINSERVELKGDNGFHEHLLTILESAKLVETRPVCILRVDDSVTLQDLVRTFDVDNLEDFSFIFDP